MGYIVSTDLVIAKGYLRSVIYDLTREEYEYIPNDLADILTEGIQLKTIEKERFLWLIEKEYILEIPNEVKGNLEPMGLNWDYPADILTLTISSDVLQTKSEFIIEMIHLHNIPSVAIIDMNNNEQEVNSFLQTIESTSTQLVEWLTKHNEEIEYITYIEKFRKLKSIVIYNSPEESQHYGEDGFGNIVQKINSYKERSVHIQHPSYFNVNTELVTESHHFHSYFNRRLHISENGEIRQSPFTRESFGNIHVLQIAGELKDVLMNPKFTKFWTITKDQTDICKECEHRYMCVDNREPQNRGNEEWYHEQECNYNPYIAQWEGEVHFLPLSKTGIRSNENEFFMDEKRIQETVKRIWGMT